MVYTELKSPGGTFMSSDAPTSGAKPEPQPDKKKVDLKSTFQTSLADSLGLTVTQKPAVAAKPQAPPKPERAAEPAEPKTGLFVQDASSVSVGQQMSAVRGSEPNLPKASPRIQVIEGDALRAKQGLDMPRMPVSFRLREGWSDVSGRNIGKESGFRNTRMAAHEIEAAQVKAWADYNRKTLEDRKRGPGPT
jgi:hypothetical protein